MRFRKRRFIALAVFCFAPTLGLAQDRIEAVSGTANQSNQSVGLVRSPANLSSQANQLFQNQWIRLTEEKSIRGSVTSLVDGQKTKLAKVQVSLFQDGALVLQGMTDVEGDFIIDKAKAGVYSLVASGENQIAVCSLTVLGASEGSHLPDRVNIHSLNPVTPRISDLIRGNIMPTWTVGHNLETDPIAGTRNSQGSAEIRIDPQGGISGVLARSNVSVDLGTTLVYLIRDGKEVARTRASSNGEYRFDRVSPGSYGLVASGPEGIAALGFNAIAPELASSQRTVQTLVKATARDGDNDSIPAPTPVSPKLNVELAEPNCYVPAEVISIEECVVCEEAPACPTMCGCWGGAGMGGSGMGGGGGAGAAGGLGAGGLGGIGTLGALGALTAVAISAADDSGDEAPIVSPVK